MAAEAYHHFYEEDHLALNSFVIVAMPASATVSRVRMTATLTWQQESVDTVGPGIANSGLLWGLGTVGHGGALTQITTSNTGSGIWLTEGIGHMVGIWSEVVDSSSVTSYFYTRSEITQFDYTWPTFFSPATDLYVSYTWLYASFYGTTPWVSIQTETWTA